MSRRHIENMPKIKIINLCQAGGNGCFIKVTLIFGKGREIVQ